MEVGLELGSLKGVGGYDEAILQKGHGVDAIESMARYVKSEVLDKH